MKCFSQICHHCIRIRRTIDTYFLFKCFFIRPKQCSIICMPAVSKLVSMFPSEYTVPLFLHLFLQRSVHYTEGKLLHFHKSHILQSHRTKHFHQLMAGSHRELPRYHPLCIHFQAQTHRLRIDSCPVLPPLITHFNFVI